MQFLHLSKNFSQLTRDPRNPRHAKYFVCLAVVMIGATLHASFSCLSRISHDEILSSMARNINCIAITSTYFNVYERKSKVPRMKSRFFVVFCSLSYTCVCNKYINNISCLKTPKKRQIEPEPNRNYTKKKMKTKKMYACRRNAIK